MLDQTEISDQYITGFENDEKSERLILENEKDKDAITLVQPVPDVDMSMPKWPTYESPVLQKMAILSELEEVKKTRVNYDMSEQEDLKHQLPMTEGPDIQNKQASIDASHKLQVDKIKSGIYADRQNFLEKML